MKMSKCNQSKAAIVLTLFFVLLIGFNACKHTKEIAISPAASAKEVYEQAKRYIKRDPDRARLLFKEVMQLFPDSIYARLGKIGIADSYFREKGAASLVMAAAEYQEYVNLYPQSPDAAYASYQVGICYFRQMKKPGRDQTAAHEALKHFNSMVKKYPGTKEAEDAEKKIVKIRENLAAHYYRIGLADYRLKAFEGAISRYKQVIDNYPEYKNNDRTFYQAGRAYFALRDFDSAISFFQRVINSYPKSKYIKKSQRFIKKIIKLKKKQKPLKKNNPQDKGDKDQELQ